MLSRVSEMNEGGNVGGVRFRMFKIQNRERMTDGISNPKRRHNATIVQLSRARYRSARGERRMNAARRIAPLGGRMFTAGAGAFEDYFSIEKKAQPCKHGCATSLRFRYDPDWLCCLDGKALGGGRRLNRAGFFF